MAVPRVPAPKGITTAGGAVGGAAIGAVVGGPFGIIPGAILGAAGGWLFGEEKKKPDEKTPPTP